MLLSDKKFVNLYKVSYKCHNTRHLKVFQISIIEAKLSTKYFTEKERDQFTGKFYWSFVSSSFEDVFNYT